MFCVIYKNDCYYCSNLCKSSSSHSSSLQKGLGLKNISHQIRKQIQGMYETKYPTEKQKRKHIGTEEELTKQDTDDSKIKYVRSDLMEKNNKKL